MLFFFYTCQVVVPRYSHLTVKHKPPAPFVSGGSGVVWRVVFRYICLFSCGRCDERQCVGVCACACVMFCLCPSVCVPCIFPPAVCYLFLSRVHLCSMFDCNLSAVNFEQLRSSTRRVQLFTKAFLYIEELFSLPTLERARLYSCGSFRFIWFLGGGKLSQYVSVVLLCNQTRGNAISVSMCHRWRSSQGFCAQEAPCRG